MEMGKALCGKESAALADIGRALAAAEEGMLARGGAALGDKTALDLLHAVRIALAEKSGDPTALIAAAADALDAFRNLPNRIGRAQMFADRSAGLDDPGMLAFAKLVAAIVKGCPYAERT